MKDIEGFVKKEIDFPSITETNAIAENKTENKSEKKKSRPTLLDDGYVCPRKTARINLCEPVSFVGNSSAFALLEDLPEDWEDEEEEEAPIESAVESDMDEVYEDAPLDLFDYEKMPALSSVIMSPRSIMGVWADSDETRMKRVMSPMPKIEMMPSSSFSWVYADKNWSMSDPKKSLWSEC